MKKILMAIVVSSLVILFPKESVAAEIFTDNFEKGVGNWQTPSSIIATPEDTDEGSTHGKLLHIRYPGNNIPIKISLNNISSLVSDRSNLVYEIEFWDDPARDYGVGFYAMDSAGRYIEFVVKQVNGNYELRNGQTSFDSAVKRSPGWHKVQIIATDVGTYLAIDGINLSYLRGKIPHPSESVDSFPINNEMKSVSEVGIEYPSWGKPASDSYWDNFKIYEFRPQAKTTSQKEEDLIIEYLNSYEMGLTNPAFQNAAVSLKGVQNFQLSRLGLAAAYGVRYKVYGGNGDLSNLKNYLTAVLNDYWGGWQNAPWESPISGQAIAVLASWQWDNLDASLKDNIKRVLDDIGTVTNQRNCIGQMTAAYSGDQIADSKGEEFAWIASYLKFVADVYHDKSDVPVCGNSNPDLTKWSVRAANFACASTTHARADDARRVDGSDVCTNSSAVIPPNPALTNNFIMRNHAMAHPGYALTIAWGLAQAQLYQLNQGKTESQLDTDYRRNFGAFYTNNITNLIRPNNYTYKAESADDAILAYTGKDDWGQDATLQDQAWAYFDVVFKNRAGWNWTNKLDGVVNYAWLTRGGKTAYPSLMDSDLAGWVGEPTWNIPCGAGTCRTYKPGSALFFFLNSMDAIDRFQALFIIDPAGYKLNRLTSPSVPGDFDNNGTINFSDLSYYLSNLSSIFDYNQLVANYGKQ